MLLSGWFCSIALATASSPATQLLELSEELWSQRREEVVNIQVTSILSPGLFTSDRRFEWGKLKRWPKVPSTVYRTMASVTLTAAEESNLFLSQLQTLCRVLCFSQRRNTVTKFATHFSDNNFSTDHLLIVLMWCWLDLIVWQWTNHRVSDVEHPSYKRHNNQSSLLFCVIKQLEAFRLSFFIFNVSLKLFSLTVQGSYSSHDAFQSC